MDIVRYIGASAIISIQAVITAYAGYIIYKMFKNPFQDSANNFPTILGLLSLMLVLVTAITSEIQIIIDYIK